MAIKNNIKEHQLVNETFDSLKTHWRKIALLVWVLIGIPLVVGSFGSVDLSQFNSLGFWDQMALINNWFNSSQGSWSTQNLWIYWVIASIWVTIWTILLNGLLVLYVFQNEKRTYTGDKSVIMEFIKKIPKLIGTNIMMIFALILLFLLLIIPGVIYSVFWALVISVVLYYGSWGKVALSRSKQLVKWRRWKTVWALFVWWLVVLALALIQTVIFWVGYKYIGWNPIVDLIGNAVNLIVLPFSAFYTAHMFLSWKDSYVETLDKKEAKGEAKVEEATATL